VLRLLANEKILMFLVACAYTGAPMAPRGKYKRCCHLLPYRLFSVRAEQPHAMFAPLQTGTFFLLFGCISFFGSFLLQSLLFGKAQTDALRHFNVPFGTMFGAGNFTLVERLGPKAVHARVKASHHHIIVHAVCWGVKINIYTYGAY
jgi:hypothetical protein